MKELVNRKPKAFVSVRRLLTSMLWLRFSFLIFAALVVLLFACYFAIFLSVRRRDQVEVEAERLKRLPMVRYFLAQRARKYDPSTLDKVAIDQCSICLEKFSEGDERLIAELNCSNKHIFHVDCL